VLDLAMHRVAPKMRVILFFLHPLGLEFFVAGGHVARNGLIFFARFGAFQNDGVSWHDFASLIGKKRAIIYGLACVGNNKIDCVAKKGFPALKFGVRLNIISPSASEFVNDPPEPDPKPHYHRLTMFKKTILIITLSLISQLPLWAEATTPKSETKTAASSEEARDPSSKNQDTTEQASQNGAEQAGVTIENLKKQVASLQAKMADQTAELAAISQKLDARSAQLEALQGVNKTLMAKVSERDQALADTSAELAKTAGRLAKEKAALEELKPLAANWQASHFEAQAEARRLQELKENPEIIAKKIVDIAFPRESLNALVGSKSAQFAEKIRSAELPTVLKERSLRYFDQFQKELQEAFDYGTLRASLVDQFVDNFSPSQLVFLMNAYEGDADTLADAANLQNQFMTAIAARLQLAEAEFEADMGEWLSSEATTKFIKERLENIARAGEAYLDRDGLKDEVRFTELLVNGYVEPVKPISGETYLGLTIYRDGGVLIVEKDDGTKVLHRY